MHSFIQQLFMKVLWCYQHEKIKFVTEDLKKLGLLLRKTDSIPEQISQLELILEINLFNSFKGQLRFNKLPEVTLLVSGSIWLNLRSQISNSLPFLLVVSPDFFLLYLKGKKYHSIPKYMLSIEL